MKRRRLRVTIFAQPLSLEIILLHVLTSSFARSPKFELKCQSNLNRASVGLLLDFGCNKPSSARVEEASAWGSATKAVSFYSKLAAVDDNGW